MSVVSEVLVMVLPQLSADLPEHPPRSYQCVCLHKYKHLYWFFSSAFEFQYFHFT